VIAKWMIERYDYVAPSLSVGSLRFAIVGRRNLPITESLFEIIPLQSLEETLMRRRKVPTLKDKERPLLESTLQSRFSL
jgi:hypothetical protein